MRFIAAIGLSAALALAFSFSVSTEVEAKKRAPKAKACSATNDATKRKLSWRCAGTEKCCYDPAMHKGSCQPANVNLPCL